MRFRALCGGWGIPSTAQRAGRGSAKQAASPRRSLGNGSHNQPHKGVQNSGKLKFRCIGWDVRYNSGGLQRNEGVWKRFNSSVPSISRGAGFGQFRGAKRFTGPPQTTHSRIGSTVLLTVV